MSCWCNEWRQIFIYSFSFYSSMYLETFYNYPYSQALRLPRCAVEFLKYKISGQKTESSWKCLICGEILSPSYFDASNMLSASRYDTISIFSDYRYRLDMIAIIIVSYRYRRYFPEHNIVSISYRIDIVSIFDKIST